VAGNVVTMTDMNDFNQGVSPVLRLVRN